MAGIGVDFDYKQQSIHYLNLAVDQGMEEAHGLLAELYMKGLGVEQNHVKAIYLLRQEIYLEI